MNAMQIANSTPMWIAAALPVLLIIAQAVLFLKNARKAAKEIGIPEEKIGKAVKSAAITSIGPSIVILSGMLSLFGYTVVCTKNGQEAVDLFHSETNENRKIKGIIFDLTVPGGMGGKEAIHEIRKTNKDIPVFVASGYADDPVMNHPSHFGFTASISKPFNVRELSDMLNTFLK